MRNVLLYLRKSRDDENESKEETLARHERMLIDYCKRYDLLRRKREPQQSHIRPGHSLHPSDIQEHAHAKHNIAPAIGNNPCDAKAQQEFRIKNQLSQKSKKAQTQRLYICPSKKILNTCPKPSH